MRKNKLLKGLGLSIPPIIICIVLLAVLDPGYFFWHFYTKWHMDLDRLYVTSKEFQVDNEQNIPDGWEIYDLKAIRIPMPSKLTKIKRIGERGIVASTDVFDIALLEVIAQESLGSQVYNAFYKELREKGIWDYKTDSPYQLLVKMFNITPDEIKLTNSRSENIIVNVMLILKQIDLKSSADEVYTFDGELSKGFISVGKNSFIEIMSNDESKSTTIILRFKTADKKTILDHIQPIISNFSFNDSHVSFNEVSEAIDNLISAKSIYQQHPPPEA
jgi:hypothetical protein